MRRKAQTAVEFLTSYGWAIIVLALALVALYATGALNLFNYPANNCAITSGFSCLSFFMSSNGVLTVNLEQSIGAPINVTALGCNENGTVSNMQAPFNPPTNQIAMTPGANYTFRVQCYTNSSTFATNIGNKFNGYILINYTNKLSQISLLASGKLSLRAT